MTTRAEARAQRLREAFEACGPWTYGPDERGRYFAAGHCSHCRKAYDSEGYVESRAEAKRRVVERVQSCACREGRLVRIPMCQQGPRRSNARK